MKNAGYIASTVGVLAVVAGIVGAGVYLTDQANRLTHPPAFAVTMPDPVVSPAITLASDQAAPDFSALSAQLQSAASDPRLGHFVGQVRDVETGTVVLSHNPDQAVRPASATKILTAAAALYELGWDDRILTTVVSGDSADTVVIKAAGDTNLSMSQIDDLASQLQGREIKQVLVDASLWTSQTFAPSWDPVDIDAGYIAPIEPVMIEGGRIGGSHGDLPRSHTPAIDVAAALAQRIGASQTGTGVATGTEVLASTESDTLENRLRRMMEESDNVMAESIAREFAQTKGAATDAASTAQLTLDILAERGFDISGVSIVDNSGLSFENLITPQLLEDILYRAATEDELRTLLGALPIAHGTGTLTDRFEDLSGAGWVRAKTGTLTDTSALAGVVTSTSNRVFSFAFVSNDSNVNDARAALDELASILRDF